jgi:hypothetical protein
MSSGAGLSSGCRRAFLFLLFSYVLPAPALPVAEVEQGWQQILTEAFLRHAQFGLDIKFTYGPWGFISEPLGDPRAYGWLILARGCLGGAVALALGWQMEALRNNFLRFLALAVVLPLAAPAGIVLLQFVLLYSRPKPAPSWLLVLLLAACGLSAHTKLSLAVLFAALLLYLCTDEVIRQRRIPFLATVGVATYLGWYSLAGQHLGNLPEYLISAQSVLSGYGEALALPPTKGFPSVVAFVCLAALACWAVTSIRNRQSGRIAASIWIAIFLLVGIKQAFGRADFIHHWWGVFNLILPGLMLLAGQLAEDLTPHAAVASVTAVASFSVIAFAYSGFHGNNVAQIRADAAIHNLSRAAEEWVHPGHLATEYQSRMDSLRRACSLPEFRGAIDVFENRLTCGLVFGDRFRWRPNFMMYSTYTADLTAQNAEFLRSRRAAPNLLLGIRPRDEDYAPLEDCQNIVFRSQRDFGTHKPIPDRRRWAGSRVKVTCCGGVP